MSVSDENPGARVRAEIETHYRSDSRRVLATLIRLLGDFELAEEALHDAFAAALDRWPIEGLPDQPRAWLVSTGRFKAIDRLRRRARFDAVLGSLADQLEAATPEPDLDEGVDDDRLRLIFTCCHPALTADARIALTLREVCGLTTEEIARAFLTPAPTIAQRIVRAKAKIRDARIPYRSAVARRACPRLDAVLHVIYLVFSEGYSASAGDSLTRRDLGGEAIRLGRCSSICCRSRRRSAAGVDAAARRRRAARTSPERQLVLLDDQDRGLWNRARIQEAPARRARRRRTASARRAAAAIAPSTERAAGPTGGDRRPTTSSRESSRRR